MNDALLESLGLPQLVPESLAPWRPLVFDGVRFFLQRLPAYHRKAVLASQLTLPANALPATRLVTLLAQCPTLHKLGQILAHNRQLPAELRLELQTLESMLLFTPMRQVLDRIRRELPGELPLTLGRQALAEGSVAVVLPFIYRENGQARDGVFKVLKPGIEEKFSGELAVWLELGSFLEQRSRYFGLPALDYRGTLDSVRELLAREIHLRVEQENLRAAAVFYADEPRILIPRLLPWCTSQLTAMERVFGEKVTDAALSPTRRAELASTMMAALVGQPFWSTAETAMLHADLHAGNLFATTDGRLAVLDWSLTLRLSKADRESLVSVMLGGLTLDAERMCEVIAALGSMRTDDPVLRRAVERALDRVALQGCFPGFEWLLDLLDGLALQAAIELRHDLVLFRKTWFSLSGVIDELATGQSPDMQLLGLGLQRFLSELPTRLSALADPARFSTHVSNADLLRFGASTWLVGMRYWQRVWQQGIAGIAP